MKRMRRMFWTPLVLGGIAPGLLVLAVLAGSLSTHGFGLANDKGQASTAAVRISQSLDQDSDGDDQAATARHRLPTAGVLTISR